MQVQQTRPERDRLSGRGDRNEPLAVNTRVAGPRGGPAPSGKTVALFRVVILVIAPGVALFGHGYHPWIGSPGDPGFFEKLAAAVAADATRWWVSHLLVAVASGLVAIAFLAIRSYLREAGEELWSALGLPFIVMGSTLYALLPAIEFAPIGAFLADADVAAVQHALMPWSVAILVTSAVIFALGVFGFVIGIFRSQVLVAWLTWIVAGGLVVMAATRFFPVGAAQLYVGPAASAVALWPLAIAVWNQSRA